MGARFAGDIARALRDRAPDDRRRHQRRPGARRAPRRPRRRRRVKGELLEALPADGLAVLNADDACDAARCAARSRAPVADGAAAAPDADVRHHAVSRSTPSCARRSARSRRGERVDVAARRARRSTRSTNAALAAIAVARRASVSPLDASRPASPARDRPRWRMELRRRADGVTVLNDAYNANPTSMAAALERARPAAGRRAGASRCSARCASSATHADERARARSASSPRGSALDVVVGSARAARRSPPRPRRGARRASTVADADAALAARAPARAAGRRGAGEGEPRGRARAGRRRPARTAIRSTREPRVIALLIAVGRRRSSSSVARHAVAHPVPAGARHRPADPRRRPDRAPARREGGHADDGRHRDRRRRGRRLPRRAHPHRAASSSRRSGIALLVARSSGSASSASSTTTSACARGRNLGLRKRGKTGGQRDRRGRVRAARARLRDTCRRTCRSPATLDLDLGTRRLVRAGRCSSIFAHRERGEPHRRPRRPRRRVRRRSCSPRS